jgi:ABC-type bacteriocin/lantibiotic exporter with double-glycine peptidase domain
MKFTIKSLLRDKNVLMAVSVISVLNLIGLVMLRNFDAVVFFVVTGFLMTYFSKNMIIVMLVAMLSTNLFISARLLQPIIKEGMKGTKKKKKQDNEDEDEDDENTGKIDANATKEAAHENLQTLLSGPAINKMSQDTLELMSNQNDLNKSLETIMPAMEKSIEALEQFGGMDKITGMIDKLSSITGAFGGKKNE